MINLIINDHTYKVPSTWEEVTLGQWVALAGAGDNLNHIKLLSIFTNLSEDVLANLPCDAVKTDLIPEMDFIRQPIDLMTIPRPGVLELNGKTISVITDPGRERFGQKLFIQQLVTAALEREAGYWELVAPTIACYYAPFLHPDNKWDDRHVKAVEPYVYDMPVTVAYPEAIFFLNGYLKLRRQNPSS